MKCQKHKICSWKRVFFLCLIWPNMLYFLRVTFLCLKNFNFSSCLDKSATQMRANTILFFSLYIYIFCHFCLSISPLSLSLYLLLSLSLYFLPSLSSLYLLFPFSIFPSLFFSPYLSSLLSLPLSLSLSPSLSLSLSLFLSPFPCIHINTIWNNNVHMHCGRRKPDTLYYYFLRDDWWYGILMSKKSNYNSSFFVIKSSFIQENNKTFRPRRSLQNNKYKVCSESNMAVVGGGSPWCSA